MLRAYDVSPASARSRRYLTSLTSTWRPHRFRRSVVEPAIHRRPRHPAHGHLAFSYKSLMGKEPQVVDAEDVVPSRGPHETDVWLTQWQVAEDGLDVAFDQHVDWALVPMDQDWLGRLFAVRRTVPLQLNTYADAVRKLADASAWTLLSGRGARIDQISVRYQPSEDSAEPGARLPEAGGAMQHSVPSLQKPRAHHGELVGWIARIQG